jgi:hypothetical protein
MYYTSRKSSHSQKATNKHYYLSSSPSLRNTCPKLSVVACKCAGSGSWSVSRDISSSRARARAPFDSVSESSTRGPSSPTLVTWSPVLVGTPYTKSVMVCVKQVHELYLIHCTRSAQSWQGTAKVSCRAEEGVYPCWTMAWFVPVAQFQVAIAISQVLIPSMRPQPSFLVTHCFDSRPRLFGYLVCRRPTSKIQVVTQSRGGFSSHTFHDR